MVRVQHYGLDIAIDWLDDENFATEKKRRKKSVRNFSTIQLNENNRWFGRDGNDERAEKKKYNVCFSISHNDNNNSDNNKRNDNLKLSFSQSLSSKWIRKQGKGKEEVKG